MRDLPDPNKLSQISSSSMALKEPNMNNPWHCAGGYSYSATRGSEKYQLLLVEKNVYKD